MKLASLGEQNLERSQLVAYPRNAEMMFAVRQLEQLVPAR